jgi:flagellar hook-length control protein FliK
MKTNAIDIREMLMNGSSISSKKTEAKGEKDFGKILNKLEAKTELSEKLPKTNLNNASMELEEEAPYANGQEEPSLNEEEILIQLIDISLLLSLISKDSTLNENTNENMNENINENINIESTSLNEISKIVDFSSVEELAGLLSSISDKDKKSEVLNFLKANEGEQISFNRLKMLFSDNGSLPELLTLDGSSENNEQTAVLQELKLDIMPNKVMLKANSSISGNEETAQNNIEFKKNELEINSFDATLEDDNKSFESDTDIKENKILKGIINSDDKSENKILTFSAHLSRAREVLVPIQSNSEATVVNKNTLVNDVVKVIKYMNINSLKELTIKVTPVDLGEMTIKVTMEGNLLKANISASNKETYSLLNSNIADLKNSLNNSQIKVQEVAINIYNDDTTFFSGNFEGRQQNFNEHSGSENNSRSSINIEKIETSEAIENLSGEDNNLSVLA